MSTPLSALAAALGDAERRGPDVAVDDVTHDSRRAGPGVLFCAIPGEVTDGHDHAPAAVAAGTPALLVERWLDLDVAQVRVPSVRAAAGPAAARVHGHPAERLAVVGVTGTNGKTTTAYLVEAAAAAGGLGTGVIGTIETRVHGVPEPGVRTTPESTDLQRLLATMHARGVDVVAMEVSSHGLALHRVDGTRFAVGVFTNLTQDHLDFHGTMEAYLAAKQRLFAGDLAERAVVWVSEDGIGARVAAEAAVPVTTVGEVDGVDHRLVDVETGLDGVRGVLRGPDGDLPLSTRLLGRHNLANAACAVLAAVAAGVAPDAAVAGVAACPGVPGRLEQVTRPDGPTGAGPRVFVDYAHTPDALERVVGELRAALPPAGRLHVVVGCGGDRDRGKRPLMGAVAARADLAVLTSDNPRSEDPDAILAAVRAGAEEAVAAGAPAEVVVQADRRAAIRTAVARAAEADVVLVAGKGHETGQEAAGVVRPFDDRVEAAAALAERAAGTLPTDRTPA
ncbi:MAG: UDP-N-acetylmuramoyl-L-alanyl-D-glutamate--2,6-diaminopimelate ligase [Actinomycetes bacterium]